MKETVVLYPFVGVGHLVLTVELAKLFLHHGFAVTIVVIDSPFDTTSTTASFISRVSSAHPSISFHRLPTVSLPPRPSFSPLVLIFDLIRLNNPHLHNFLTSFSQITSIRALVLDFFCTEALDVAAELRLLSYFFFSPSASSLAACLLLPTLISQTSGTLKDLGETTLHFPGLPPVPASHVPSPFLDPNNEAHQDFLFIFNCLPKADGIIVNTFESLEARAVRALNDGLCVPSRLMPPVYCIGPLIADGSGEGEKHECLAWLDTQPRRSVVFLCFGSMGTFSEEQLKEIASGLEGSGQRFLCVVRSPPTKDLTDLDDLLPDGFLERM